MAVVQECGRPSRTISMVSGQSDGDVTPRLAVYGHIDVLHKIADSPPLKNPTSATSPLHVCGGTEEDRKCVCLLRVFKRSFEANHQTIEKTSTLNTNVTKYSIGGLPRRVY